jgi:hypothetical protein
MILSKGSNNDWSYGMQMDATTGLPNVYAWQSNGNSYCYASGTQSIANGMWHHLLGVLVDGVGVYLYVDGVLAGSRTSPVGSWNKASAASLRIGGRSDGTQTFLGNLDDVRIWKNTALTLTDAQTLYAGGEPATAPTARWKFDDGPQYGEPSNGDPISVWESREGQAWNFTQLTAANRPTYVQSGQGG